ncbi:MAG: undecaprenyl-diphosphate phosphatase [Clostridia bacterium]|nr:undecaprenyl-diphosphate phosphatase [Clostridia bacterium]
MRLIEVLYAFLMGVVEGITEWLPVSSTGHMILLDRLFTLDFSAAFTELFLVVIQLGAILAVLVYFFNRLNPFSTRKTADEKKQTYRLWGKVIVGMLPAMVAGVLLKVVYGSIPDNPFLIAAALILYGVLFIVIERRQKHRTYRVNTTDELSYKDALLIGLFQALSIIPGTSRSGSTIIGGMLMGVSRTVAAEFTFFMAIPVMAGASLIEVLGFVKDGVSLSGTEIGALIIGIVVSFLVSLLVIRFLMDFVKRHSFEVFGWYRIALGAVVIVVFSILRAVA